MSQNCECDKPVVKAPVRGLELALDQEALGGIGGDCCVDYSYEEQWTGKLWVDGKKIYQKTLSIAPGTSGDLIVPHGITRIDNIIGMPGSMLHGSNFLALPHRGRLNSGINIYATSTDLVVQFLTNYTTTIQNAFITLYYTCTDR